MFPAAAQPNKPHAADGSARLQRKAIAFMRWDEFSNGLDRLARSLTTRQLMRRAVGERC